LFVYRTNVKDIRFFFIIVFSFYYNIFFDKIIKKIFFIAFDVVLYYLLKKRAQIRQFTKQITTIEKKKQTNRFKKYFYKLILCNKCTLIYIETIYVAKFRNCIILDLDSENNLQNLITIKTAIFATRLEIVLEVF